MHVVGCVGIICWQFWLFAEQGRILMQHIEFKLRNLKIKSDQPQSLRFVLLISGNVTAKGGEGVRGRGRGPRESGLSSINTSFIRTYYPTGPGSPMHFIKASSWKRTLSYFWNQIVFKKSYLLVVLKYSARLGFKQWSTLPNVWSVLIINSCLISLYF